MEKSVGGVGGVGGAEGVDMQKQCVDARLVAASWGHYPHPPPTGGIPASHS